MDGHNPECSCLLFFFQWRNINETMRVVTFLSSVAHVKIKPVRVQERWWANVWIFIVCLQCCEEVYTGGLLLPELAGQFGTRLPHTRTAESRGENVREHLNFSAGKQPKTCSAGRREEELWRRCEPKKSSRKKRRKEREGRWRDKLSVQVEPYII